MARHNDDKHTVSVSILPEKKMTTSVPAGLRFGDIDVSYEPARNGARCRRIRAHSLYGLSLQQKSRKNQQSWINTAEVPMNREPEVLTVIFAH